MFEKIGMSARAMPYKKAAKQKGQATDPMEANKVRVHRAKWQKAKAPCVQPLVLTMRQATSHCQC